MASFKKMKNILKYSSFVEIAMNSNNLFASDNKKSGGCCKFSKDDNNEKKKQEKNNQTQNQTPVQNPVKTPEIDSKKQQLINDCKGLLTEIKTIDSSYNKTVNEQDSIEKLTQLKNELTDKLAELKNKPMEENPKDKEKEKDKDPEKDKNPEGPKKEIYDDVKKIENECKNLADEIKKIDNTFEWTYSGLQEIQNYKVEKEKLEKLLKEKKSNKEQEEKLKKIQEEEKKAELYKKTIEAAKEIYNKLSLENFETSLKKIREYYVVLENLDKLNPRYDDEDRDIILNIKYDNNDNLLKLSLIYKYVNILHDQYSDIYSNKEYYSDNSYYISDYEGGGEKYKVILNTNKDTISLLLYVVNFLTSYQPFSDFRSKCSEKFSDVVIKEMDNLFYNLKKDDKDPKRLMYLEKTEKILEITYYLLDVLKLETITEEYLEANYKDKQFISPDTTWKDYNGIANRNDFSGLYMNTADYKSLSLKK